MGGHLFSPRFRPEAPVLRRALLSTRDPEESDCEETGGSDADFGGLRLDRLVAGRGGAGCDHKTVAHWVRVREAAAGEVLVRARRPAPVMVDPFAEKVDELVDRSNARIRADKAHGVLVAMGYEGSYRTTRRAVAAAKRRWRARHGRRTRPWIPQPGLWVQWDWGEGPVVAGVRSVLFCAWLAWSRFRVVVALRDKTMPSVVIGLDRTLRLIDGCPTYALTEYVPGHISGIKFTRGCKRRGGIGDCRR
jgi:hypothetical protein